MSSSPPLVVTVTGLLTRPAAAATSAVATEPVPQAMVSASTPRS